MSETTQKASLRREAAEARLTKKARASRQTEQSSDPGECFVQIQGSGGDYTIEKSLYTNFFWASFDWVKRAELKPLLRRIYEELNGDVLVRIKRNQVFILEGYAPVALLEIDSVLAKL